MSDDGKRLPHYRFSPDKFTKSDPLNGDNKFKIWKRKIVLSVAKPNGQLWITSIWIFMANAGHVTSGRGQAER